MAGVLSAANFRFLFREDKGAIDRRTWRIATLALFVVLVVVVAGLAVLDMLVAGAVSQARNPERGLSTMTTFTSSAFFTVILHLALLLVFVCHYYVSAKRYNDLGKSCALGLLIPASLYLIIIAPALTEQILPVFGRWCIYAVLTAVIVWQIAELGWRRGRL